MIRRIYKATGLLLLTLFLIPLTFTSCKTQSGANLPIAKSFSHKEVISGQNGSAPDFTRIPESGVWIRSIHQEDSIMLEIRTRDTLTLRSLLVNGVSIWVDPEAGTNQEIGITFPAARSEMMRRQEELLTERQQQNDTIAPRIMFNPNIWVEAIQKREAVITDPRGTRFANKADASVSMAENGDLVYRVRFSFDQLGISKTDQQRISAGVVSDLHQAQMAGGQGGAVATRPTIQGRDRQQTQRPPRQQMPRQRFIPVNAWIALLINEELPPSKPVTDQENSQANPANNTDDVYFRRQ